MACVLGTGAVLCWGHGEAFSGDHQRPGCRHRGAPSPLHPGSPRGSPWSGLQTGGVPRRWGHRGPRQAAPERKPRCRPSGTTRSRPFGNLLLPEPLVATGAPGQSAGHFLVQWGVTCCWDSVPVSPPPPPRPEAPVPFLGPVAPSTAEPLGVQTSSLPAPEEPPKTPSSWLISLD